MSCVPFSADDGYTIADTQPARQQMRSVPDSSARAGPRPRRRAAFTLGENVRMSPVQPFLPAAEGTRPSAAVFLSGSGSNASRVLERWESLAGACSYDVSVLVTDAPETSRARELGQTFGLPVVENDIRRFYRDRGETRVSIATQAGQRIRSEWTDALRRQLAGFRVDFGVLAGFVPLTNLTGDYPCLNVHPGDLTYLKYGRRYLVGLHTVPIERAIVEGLTELRSSVIVALPYTGRGDDMDNGPLLGVSGPVSIDLRGNTVEELTACLGARPAKRPRGGYGDALEAAAEASQEQLKERGDWVVFPRVVSDFARGRFARGNDGGVWYLIAGKWQPVIAVVYSNEGREVVFRAVSGDGRPSSRPPQARESSGS